MAYSQPKITVSKVPTSMQNVGSTADADGDIQYLKSWMNPFEVSDAYLPDDNLSPFIPKTVMIDSTIKGLTDFMIFIKHHDTDGTVQLYKKTTVAGTTAYWHVKDLPFDSSLAASYVKVRPLSGGVYVQSATQSTTNVELGGQITAVLCYALPDDWSLITPDNMTTYRSSDIDVKAQVPLAEGIVALSPPPTNFSTMFRSPTTNALKTVSNNLDIEFEHRRDFAPPYYASGNFFRLEQSETDSLLPTLFGRTRVLWDVQPWFASTGYYWLHFLVTFYAVDDSDNPRSTHHSYPMNFCNGSTYNHSGSLQIVANYPIKSIVAYFTRDNTAIDMPAACFCDISVENGEYQVDGYSTPCTMIAVKGVDVSQVVTVAGKWNYEAQPNQALASEVKFQSPPGQSASDMMAIKVIAEHRVSLGIPLVIPKLEYKDWKDKVAPLASRSKAYGLTSDVSPGFGNLISGVLKPLLSSAVGAIPMVGPIIKTFAGLTADSGNLSSSSTNWPTGFTADSKDKKGVVKLTDFLQDLVSISEKPITATAAAQQLNASVPDVIGAVSFRGDLFHFWWAKDFWFTQGTMTKTPPACFMPNHSTQWVKQHARPVTTYSVGFTADISPEKLAEFLKSLQAGEIGAAEPPKSAVPTAHWTARFDVRPGDLKAFMNGSVSLTSHPHRSFHIVYLEGTDKRPTLTTGYLSFQQPDIDLPFEKIEVGHVKLSVTKQFLSDTGKNVLLGHAEALQPWDGAFLWCTAAIIFEGHSWAMPFSWMLQGLPRVCVASGGMKISSPVGEIYTPVGDSLIKAQLATNLPVLLASDETSLRATVKLINSTTQPRVIACYTDLQMKAILSTFYRLNSVAPAKMEVGIEHFQKAMGDHSYQSHLKNAYAEKVQKPRPRGPAAGPAYDQALVVMRTQIANEYARLQRQGFHQANLARYAPEAAGSSQKPQAVNPAFSGKTAKEILAVARESLNSIRQRCSKDSVFDKVYGPKIENWEIAIEGMETSTTLNAVNASNFAIGLGRVLTSRPSVVNPPRQKKGHSARRPLYTRTPASSYDEKPTTSSSSASSSSTPSAPSPPSSSSSTTKSPPGMSEPDEEYQEPESSDPDSDDNASNTF